MSRNKHVRFATRRPLQLESLERRELLAGNVTAQVTGNTLIVRGNNADNVVAIIQVAEGVYAVAGLDTTVNGSSGPFVTNRPVRNITADMGKGNDLLGFSNDAVAAYELPLIEFGIDVEAIVGIPAEDVQAFIDASTSDDEFNLPGNVSIKMGDGNDGFELLGTVGGNFVANLGGGQNAFGLFGTSLPQRAAVGGTMSIVGGSLTDVVTILETNVAGATSVVLGDGANFVTAEGAAFGSLSIVTGKHEDLVHIESTDIRNSLSVVTGAGNDSVIAHDHENGDVNVGLNEFINTGAGHDYVEVEGDIGGSLTILTGDGNDGVDVFDTRIRYNLTIDTGKGNDHSDLEVGSSSFSGNGGVFLEDVNVGNFAYIYLGAGNDTLDILTSRARRAYLYGGAGFDSLSVDSDSLAAIDFFFRTQFEDENLFDETPV